MGEIIVQGVQATPGYITHPDKTRMARIPDPEGGFWLRMGDLGFLDEQGGLWFCGRKAHRVWDANGTFLDTVPLESLFNRHPDIRRAALVGLQESSGRTIPAIVIERKDRRVRLRAAEKNAFVKELGEIAASSRYHPGIHHYFLSSRLPVDARHKHKN